MYTLLRKFHRDERAQDLVEYGLIALIVALGAISGMGQLAMSINKEFTHVASALS